MSDTMFQAVFLIKEHDAARISEKLEILLRGRGFVFRDGLEEFPDGHHELVAIDKPMEGMEERVADPDSERKTSAQRAGVEMSFFPAVEGIYLYVTVLPYMELMDHPEVIGITTDGTELATDIKLSEDIFRWLIPRVEKRLEAELITTRVQVPEWVSERIRKGAGGPDPEDESVSWNGSDGAAKEELIRVKRIALAYRKKMQQLRRDLATYRKQNHTDTERFTDQRFGAFALDLLEVIDNLKRALVSAQSAGDDRSTLEGIFLIHKQMEELLLRNKVAVIPVKVGDSFDPSVHYAISSEKAAGKGSGIVLREDTRGYTYKGRTLRPARVVVSA